MKFSECYHALRMLKNIQVAAAMTAVAIREKDGILRSRAKHPRPRETWVGSYRERGSEWINKWHRVGRIDEAKKSQFSPGIPGRECDRT